MEGRQGRVVSQADIDIAIANKNSLPKDGHLDFTRLLIALSLTVHTHLQVGRRNDQTGGHSSNGRLALTPA